MSSADRDTKMRCHGKRGCGGCLGRETLVGLKLGYTHAKRLNDPPSARQGADTNGCCSQRDYPNRHHELLWWRVIVDRESQGHSAHSLLAIRSSVAPRHEA